MQYKTGKLGQAEYEAEVQAYITYAIKEQEKMGVDVLVHGEPERTDMCAAPSSAPIPPLPPVLPRPGSGRKSEGFFSPRSLGCGLAFCKGVPLTW